MIIWLLSIFAHFAFFMFAVWLAALHSNAEKAVQWSGGTLLISIAIMLSLMAGSFTDTGMEQVEEEDEFHQSMSRQNVMSHCFKNDTMSAEQGHYYKHSYFKTQYVTDTVPPDYYLEVLHPAHILRLSYACKEAPICKHSCGHYETVLVPQTWGDYMCFS